MVDASNMEMISASTGTPGSVRYLEGANQTLARFADLYDTGEIPEYHDVVDTIIAWGEEILAYHSSGRVSNGPIEGINNLLQVLRRVAHGFTNYDNYAARGVLVT